MEREKFHAMWQPYSSPLRTIAEIIVSCSDDAEAIRLITDYLEHSGVPVRKRQPGTEG